jgi:hypothetical protein
VLPWAHQPPGLHVAEEAAQHGGVAYLHVVEAPVAEQVPRVQRQGGREPHRLLKKAHQLPKSNALAPLSTIRCERRENLAAVDGL